MLFRSIISFPVTIWFDSFIAYIVQKVKEENQDKSDKEIDDLIIKELEPYCYSIKVNGKEMIKQDINAHNMEINIDTFKDFLYGFVMAKLTNNIDNNK